MHACMLLVIIQNINKIIPVGHFLRFRCKCSDPDNFHSKETVMAPVQKKRVFFQMCNLILISISISTPTQKNVLRKNNCFAIFHYASVLLFSLVSLTMRHNDFLHLALYKQ